MCFWPAGQWHRLAAKVVQSRLPFVVSPPSDVSLCPSPALAGQVVWSQYFGPSCCSCVLSSRGGSGAAFYRTLSCSGLRLTVPTVWWSSSWSFLGLFAGVLSSRFQCLLIARGGCRIVLGYPPSVAWRREVLPWFSVRGMSAGSSGAAEPLGSSVLRGSWSSRWGHLFQVGTVVFLSPRS